MGLATDMQIYGTDPLTGDLVSDPGSDVLGVDPLTGEPTNSIYSNSGIGGLEPPIAGAPGNAGTTGKSGSTGASILGWLGLANNIAQTGINAARDSTPVYKRPATTASGGATPSQKGTMYLIVIVFGFIVAIFFLRK